MSDVETSSNTRIAKIRRVYFAPSYLESRRKSNGLCLTLLNPKQSVTKAEQRILGLPCERSTKIGFDLPKVRTMKSVLIIAIGTAEFILVISARVFPPIFDCHTCHL